MHSLDKDVSNENVLSYHLRDLKDSQSYNLVFEKEVAADVEHFRTLGKPDYLRLGLVQRINHASRIKKEILLVTDLYREYLSVTFKQV